VEIFEAASSFSTIANFPKHKPIFAYPTEMEPEARLKVTADVKEALYEELERQRVEGAIEPRKAHVDRIERRGSELLVHFGEGESVRAHRVVVAIGRSGNHRELGVPGEELDKVTHRLFDPADHTGQRALVVGGGDSALEAAVALAEAGAQVTLCHRKRELSRPKAENVERLTALADDPSRKLEVRLGCTVRRIDGGTVTLGTGGEEETIDNEVVFAMIGREAPLDFFRRSGIPIRGEWRLSTWISFVLFFAFCVFVYNWKAGGVLNQLFREHGWFPYGVPDAVKSLFAVAADPSSLLGTLAISLEEPGFYYSLAYSTAVVAFGIRRIRFRRTPYVKVQTLTLMAIQLLPLFVLPYVLLPWLGHAGAFDTGFGKTVADELFPVAGYGHGREYWRAFGLLLAWPLFIWNVFTREPMTWWLVISLVQTFVLIPLMVRRWGKGAYCGWICSCGALAETLGDAHRHKMPHGPLWNRLNMIGQAVLGFALLLFAARAVSWIAPASGIGGALGDLYTKLLSDFAILGVSLDYYHVVDIFLAGIVGVGFYFWFSGRVWCRFACPLAALMHIYARFSRFRIFSDKKKCISCNVCTSVCHQGIDVMGFANRGRPMEDPECVRCSACVQSCPTGVLTFGRIGSNGAPVYDRLEASETRIREADGKRRLPIAG